MKGNSNHYSNARIVGNMCEMLEFSMSRSTHSQVRVRSRPDHSQVKVKFHKMSQSDEECRMRFRIYHVQDVRI